MTTHDRATNSLAHLAGQYRGETGFTARDNAILTKCVENIVAALDEGKAAAADAEKLRGELETVSTQLNEARAALAEAVALRAELEAKLDGIAQFQERAQEEMR